MQDDFEELTMSPQALTILIGGVLAFVMISSEFFLIKRTSVVTLSVCGIFKVNWINSRCIWNTDIDHIGSSDYLYIDTRFW